MRTVPQWVVGVAVLVHVPLYLWSMQHLGAPERSRGSTPLAPGEAQPGVTGTACDCDYATVTTGTVTM